MANADFKDRLLECLGGDWPQPCDLNAEVVDTRDIDGIRLQKISYNVEPEERISGWLLLPPSAIAETPAAGICVWHQHAGQWHLGKSEPAGLAGAKMHHTGLALAKEGYAVFCPDAWGFEEREQGYEQTGRNLERFLFLKQSLPGDRWRGRTSLI